MHWIGRNVEGAIPYIFRAGMETRPYGTVFVDYFVGASIARPFI